MNPELKEEIAVELHDIAAACFHLSWIIGPDGDRERVDMMYVHEALDGIGRHLKRIAGDIED